MLVPLGASSPVAAVAEQVEFTAGEGPVHHVKRSADRAVVADVTDCEDASHQHWATWTVLARRASPYRSVLAVPVPGPVGLAHEPVALALALYRRTPLARSTTPIDDALKAIGGVLSVAHHLAETGGAALADVSATRTGGSPVWLDSERAPRRAQVWRAEELLIEADPLLEREQALTALRVVAHLRGVLVDQVADDVVTRQLAAADVIGS